jgi:hypothetical protein
MERVTLLDPRRDSGGADRYLGLAQAHAGNLELARRHLEQSLILAPHHLETKLLLAEVVAVRLGDRRQFEALLSEVIDAPPLDAETDAARRRARELLQREEHFFGPKR